MGIYGIDVSNNNGRIDIHKSGLRPSFIFAKATEGTTFTDPDYDYYAVQAEDNDAQFGAYHFGHPENFDSRAEAEHFMTTCRPRSFLSMWYDYETYSADARADAEEIGYFITTAKLLVPRARIGIYANLHGLGRIGPHLHEIPFDALWVAAWSSPPAVISAKIPVAWQVHQYAVDHGIDRDYSSWSAQQLRDHWAWD